MKATSQDPDFRSSISQRQFGVMLLTTASLAALLAYIYLQERNQEWRDHVSQSSHRLDLAAEILSRDQARVRADLLFVAGLSEIKQVDTSEPGSFPVVTETFKGFLEHQKAYSQVRLIDRQGTELVRVDWDGEIACPTDHSNLQNKSGRYYVSESMRLQPGQIFTSKFDLNLENGQIELPPKPVVRFVTPVANKGQAGNLLVFNYQGQSLLQELAEISVPGNTYLIRSDGMFLLGPQEECNWGWLLGHSCQMQTRFNDIDIETLIDSAKPKASPHGIFEVRELRLGQSRLPGINSRQQLFFVSHIPSDIAFQSSRHLLFGLILVGGIMLLPLALITRFWAASIERREWQNEQIKNSEARLRELSEQLISLQEEERRNISREIHDSIGQQATAINLDLKMLRDKVNEAENLDRVIHESDQLLKSLHEFATRVRPAELDDLGLEEALQSHVEEFENRTGIECTMQVKLASAEIDTDIASHLFRIVQESLNNIAKHARAKFATIRLVATPEDNQLHLTITDDGIGLESPAIDDSSPSNFAKKTSAENRLGILGIQERVDLLKGRMEINSFTAGSRGAGTELKIWINVHDNSVDRQSHDATHEGWVKSRFGKDTSE